MEEFKYKRYHIPNVVKSLCVLRELSKSRAGLTRAEIARKTGYTESIVFRIIYTMLDYGMIVKDPKTSRYSISKKFISLAYDAIGEENIISAAHDVMADIRDTLVETVMLGILSENEVIMIDQVFGKNFFSFTGRVGLKCPLNSSAPAKAILAFLPEGEVADILARAEFSRFTANTITDKCRFSDELRSVRQCGYAVDNQEYLNGANCVGVPVFDYQSRPVAAIWITGPSDRMPNADFPKIGEIMKQKAAAVSAKLGYSPAAVSE